MRFITPISQIDFIYINSYMFNLIFFVVLEQQRARDRIEVNILN